MKYFKEWEESVMAQNDVDDKDKKKMMSRETRMGMVCYYYSLIPACFMVVFTPSVRAFVELVRYLYFSGCMLPPFSGKGGGGVNENLSVAEFVKNTQALRVCGNLPTEVRSRQLQRIQLQIRKESPDI